MKNEWVRQYHHTWGILEGIVNDFDDDSWINLGRGYMVPARLAYHILLSTKYYLEDSSVMAFPSGRTFDADWATMNKDRLPSRSDILHVLNEFRTKTERWLSEMDFSSKNESFGWAGETRAGVVIFLLKHTLYHLGELNALLYECKDGKSEENFVKALH